MRRRSARGPPRANCTRRGETSIARGCLAGAMSRAQSEGPRRIDIPLHRRAMMTSAAPAAPTGAQPGPLQTLLDAMEREHATTVRVLRAFPPDKLDLQPHPRSKTARDLAWLFVLEQGLLEKALTTGFDWSAP